MSMLTSSALSQNLCQHSLANGNTAIRWRTGSQTNCCRWRIWSTPDGLNLNPARNTREKLLLPLGDIKPLQQAGVYLAVMNQAGRYDYSNPATLFTLSDIGVSAHRYHNRLDIFTQSLENGAAQQGIEVSLLNEKGLTLTQATSDAQGHVQLENDKNAALLLARKDGQTTLLDLKLPALDLAEFNIAGAPGYSKQFFMFGPRIFIAQVKR